MYVHDKPLELEQVAEINTEKNKYQLLTETFSIPFKRLPKHKIFQFHSI